MSQALGQGPARTAGRVPWSTELVVEAAAVVSALVARLFLARLAGVELSVRTGATVSQVGGLTVAVTATAAATATLLGLHAVVAAVVIVAARRSRRRPLPSRGAA